MLFFTTDGTQVLETITRSSAFDGLLLHVGLDNKEEVKRVGKTFRETVLSLAGGVPPMEVFKKFRGREPTPDAFLRHSGLA
jgi:Zn-dependent oligopeptidase